MNNSDYQLPITQDEIAIEIINLRGQISMLKGFLAAIGVMLGDKTEYQGLCNEIKKLLKSEGMHE